MFVYKRRSFGLLSGRVVVCSVYVSARIAAVVTVDAGGVGYRTAVQCSAQPTAYSTRESLEFLLTELRFGFNRDSPLQLVWSASMVTRDSDEMQVIIYFIIKISTVFKWRATVSAILTTISKCRSNSLFNGIQNSDSTDNTLILVNRCLLHV